MLADAEVRAEQSRAEQSRAEQSRLRGGLGVKQGQGRSGE